jgi:hypothetical protein
VNSIRDTAKFPENIEIIVAIDPDEQYDTEKYPGTFFWSAPERYGYRGMNKYLNGLAELSKGDWLVNWNDDAIMLTEGWDEILMSLDPSVLIAGLQDNVPGDLVCFPAVRREAVKALGEFCVDTPHVDTWWQDIGRSSGRLQSVPIYVFHDRFDLTGGNNDATWQEGRSGLRSAEFYQSEIQGSLVAASRTIKELP